MKTHRPLFLSIIVFAVFASSVSAQRFNDQWFQLKVSVNGRTFDRTNETITPIKFTVPVYMHLTSTTNLHQYNAQIWTERNGTWANYESGARFIGTNENFLSDFSITVNGSDGDQFHIFHTVYVSSKTDESGAAEKATYSGAGEVNSGTISGLNIYGGCTVKGKLISPSKLPF